MDELDLLNRGIARRLDLDPVKKAGLTERIERYRQSLGPLGVPEAGLVLLEKRIEKNHSLSHATHLPSPFYKKGPCRGLYFQVFSFVLLYASRPDRATEVTCLLYTSDAADDLLCV